MKQGVTYNNLRQPPAGPALPQKRGSTLLRGLPSHALREDQDVWGEPAPPPPPRREEAGVQDMGLAGVSAEAVPLTRGDMLLQNGNETLLVRGELVRPFNGNS